MGKLTFKIVCLPLFPDKVRAGGSSNCGQVPMLPHPAEIISDDELKGAEPATKPAERPSRPNPAVN